MQRSTKVLALTAGLLAAPAAHAGFITDRAYFNTIPTALINFETNGAGNPVSLIQGQRLAMPAGEYAAQGVTLTGTGGPVYWTNDGNAAFDAAQTLGASPIISIPSSLTNIFTITFTVHVQAFGFFIANNRTADPLGPTFVARDISGNILETAQWGSKFIDGTLTIPNTTADYGFMGIFTSTAIASVTVTKQAAMLDDLRYSAVPAPGPIALGAIGAILAFRRRKRA